MQVLAPWYDAMPRCHIHTNFCFLFYGFSGLTVLFFFHVSVRTAPTRMHGKSQFKPKGESNSKDQPNTKPISKDEPNTKLISRDQPRSKPITSKDQPRSKSNSKGQSQGIRRERSSLCDSISTRHDSTE
ncbi:uncharacterized protein LOC112348963 isoform X3 [Selaginella moellendorffii]|uniref:uncharacterized protein LOC112348963 isoform X3 n=1 Tax=Selaginella moellendorffii TaxID=88036 RepID=UPI000D1CED17|nr:uncharacterized protein LOC112348963 isoform X3 [Selaginella moellendorffii]|eukprot:XP_024538200.1 uncharacterized protein LOC112348963 isoform X3 [Selaginella moellendorffii]